MPDKSRLRLHNRYKIQFNIILSSRPRTYKLPFPIVFLHQNPIFISRLTLRPTRPIHLIVLDFINWILCGEVYKSCNCSFLWSRLTQFNLIVVTAESDWTVMAGVLKTRIWKDAVRSAFGVGTASIASKDWGSGSGILVHFAPPVRCFIDGRSIDRTWKSGVHEVPRDIQTMFVSNLRLQIFSLEIYLMILMFPSVCVCIYYL